MHDRVYKEGLQSKEDPFTFVMSTAAKDRQGDVVEQDWVLRNFLKNPIALWAHDSDVPIGVWEDVRVEGGKLLGRLVLAAKGTSEFIDTLRSLIEQRIIRAVSVGFMPGKAVPLDKDKPWGGLRLSQNELLETSPVSVPANAEALSLAKGLGSVARKRLFSETADPVGLSAAEQLGLRTSRVSDPEPTLSPSPPEGDKRNSTMSLAKKIEAAEKALVEKKDALTNLMEAEYDTEDEQEDADLQIEQLTLDIEKAEKGLDRLIKAENALAEKTISARKSVRETPESDPSEGSYETITRGSRVGSRTVTKKGHSAIATVAYMLKGYVARTHPLEILRTENPEDKAELEIMIRAATDPADTSTPAWAGNLVQERWEDFVDLLRDVSVYPQLPGFRLQFDRNGVLNVPKNDGRGTLAGDFIAEGAPIPVKEGVVGTTSLTPKKMAVISSYTREIARSSTPAIEGIINTQILGDTAELLDTRLLDAGARTAVRPAGYQDTTETVAANVNTATGATVATIIADATGMITRLMAARVSTGAVWIMNPINAVHLRNVQDAASGSFPFRAEVSAGTFMGFPLVMSQNVAVDTVFLQGDRAVAYAAQFAPMIEVSEQATLVMDDTAPDHIVDGAAVTTMPVRSMFQMDAVAVKMTVGLDWRIVRPGGVQVLDTVAWG